MFQHSSSTSNIKKKDISTMSPYDSLNKQTNTRAPNYLTSSRNKSNRSLVEDEVVSSAHQDICLKHSLAIKDMCFSCNFELMCVQCLKSQVHIKKPLHDIRSLEKSSSFIKNNLIQSLISLQAKSNILTNLHQQVSQSKIELYNQTSAYKKSLTKTFQYIKTFLQQKQSQLMQQIQTIYQQHQKKILRNIQQVRNVQDYYQKCQGNIRETIQYHDYNRICYFYATQRHTLNHLLNDNQLNNFRQSIYQLRYKIQNTQLSQILNALNHIRIGYDIKYTHFQPRTQSKPNSLKKIISKVKSQNQLNLRQSSKKKSKKSIKYLDLQKTQKQTNIQSRFQRQRESHKINGTFCTSTPKQNVSRQKKWDILKKTNQGSTALLKKRKKSFGKMISMPVSPAKQERQSKDRLSPCMRSREGIVQGMKKKPLVTRKKK